MQIAELYRLRAKSWSIEWKKLQRPVPHQGIGTLGIGSTIWQTQTRAKNGIFFGFRVGKGSPSHSELQSRRRV